MDKKIAELEERVDKLEGCFGAKCPPWISAVIGFVAGCLLQVIVKLIR